MRRVGEVRGIHVDVTDELGRRVPSAGLARWLMRIAPARARGIVTVALVSDARIRSLNRKYRGKNRATDVLSFPAFARQDLQRASARQAQALPETSRRVKRCVEKASPQPLAPSLHLGDILIARGVAKRQAREAGHPEPVELRVLALHGLLHLLGYDHEHDNGQMARLERRLRRKGGLHESLSERAQQQRNPVLDTPERNGVSVSGAGGGAVTSSSGNARAPRRERIARGGGAPRR